MSPRPEDLIRDARYYLGHFDLEAAQGVFHELPHDALRSHLHFAHRRFAPLRAELDDLVKAFEAEPLTSAMPRFLFMTDWCGSTLLARAIEAVGQLTLYNEPYAFVSLANDRRRQRGATSQRWQRALELSKTLMARGLWGERGGLVKEQPATNLILHWLLSGPRPARAVFLFDTLPCYLASMLKDAWRRGYTRERVQSYLELEGSPLLDGQPLSELRMQDSEIGAVHWLHQLATVSAVLDSEATERLLVVRSTDLFDAFGETLARAASALDLAVDAQTLERVLQSELMTTHSKAEHRPFDTEARHRALAEARAAHRQEIELGLLWAKRALDRLPRLRQFAQDVEG